MYWIYGQSASAGACVLPPGQHAVDGFPRFGTHLHHPAPEVPKHPMIKIIGAGITPFAVALADLATLPRRELDADFHCVAGWSATGLRWEGVAFKTFYRSVIRPAIPRSVTVTHLAFAGLDRYRSIATIEDAMADDVLLAEHLDGLPLDTDHGAPLRLVSPSQYGYLSTKHLCVIELHTEPPNENYGSVSALTGLGLRGPLFQRHPRARVWNEERHRYLPGAALRPLYRLLIPPIAFLSARGSHSDSSE